MQNYQNRAPRFDLNLPLRFFSSDGMMAGHCVNVSESGMLAIFDRPVEMWLEGDLSFFIEGRQFSIKARVARVNEGDTGLRFPIDSEEDKLTIQKLLALVEPQTSPPPKSKE